MPSEFKFTGIERVRNFYSPIDLKFERSYLNTPADPVPIPAGTRIEDEQGRTYTTFAGCDIKAVFANQTIGEIQPIPMNFSRYPAIRKETIEEKNQRYLEKRSKE